MPTKGAPALEYVELDFEDGPSDGEAEGPADDRLSLAFPESEEEPEDMDLEQDLAVMPAQVELEASPATWPEDARAALWDADVAPYLCA